MASTNKTQHYELSQFLPKDLPTWLSDYNSDMSKIDTAMAENNSLAESAITIADSATASSDSAASLVNQLKAEVKALKDIIAEGNDALSLTTVKLSNKLSTINNLTLNVAKEAKIIYFSARGSVTLADNAWSNQTGAFLADVANSEELRGLSINASSFYIQSNNENGLFTLGVGARTKPDGTVGVFLQSYTPGGNGITINLGHSVSIYNVVNAFPNVSTPVVVNFNEPVQDVNVAKADNVVVNK